MLKLIFVLVLLFSIVTISAVTMDNDELPIVRNDPPALRSVNYSLQNVNNSDYLDGYDSSDFLLLSGGTMTGDIDMDTNNILNVPNPTNAGHPVNLGYLSSVYVPYSGATSTLDLGANNFENSGDIQTQGVLLTDTLTGYSAGKVWASTGIRLGNDLDMDESNLVDANNGNFLGNLNVTGGIDTTGNITMVNSNIYMSDTSDVDQTLTIKTTGANPSEGAYIRVDSSGNLVLNPDAGTGSLYLAWDGAKNVYVKSPFLTLSDTASHFFGAGNDVRVLFDGADMLIDSQDTTANDELVFTDFDQYNFDDKVKITDQLEVWYGSALGALNIGADVNQVTRSSNTRKLASFTAPDYTNAKTVEFFNFDSTSATTNKVNFGGRAGGSSYPATELNFLTDNATNTGGIKRMSIDDSGAIVFCLTDDCLYYLNLAETGGSYLSYYDGGVLLESTGTNWEQWGDMDFQYGDVAVDETGDGYTFRVGTDRFFVGDTSYGTYNGIVGINTLFPTHDLNVVGDVNITNELIVEGNITVNSLLKIPANTTGVICSGDTEGSIYYNGGLKKHFGCNSTDWNALY